MSTAALFAAKLASAETLTQKDFADFYFLSKEEQTRYLNARWGRFALAGNAATLEICGLEFVSLYACKYYVVLKPVDGKPTVFAFVRYDSFAIVELEFMYHPEINRDPVTLKPSELEAVFQSHYVQYLSRAKLASAETLTKKDFADFYFLSKEEQIRYLNARWGRFALAGNAATLEIGCLEFVSHYACKYYVCLKPVDGKPMVFAFVRYDSFAMVELEFMYYPEINRDPVTFKPSELEAVFQSHYAIHQKRQLRLTPEFDIRSTFFAMDVLERVIMNPKGCDVSTAREELKATLTKQIEKTRDFILKFQLALGDYQDCYHTALAAQSPPSTVKSLEEAILKSWDMICLGMEQLNHYEARLARVDTL